MQKTNEVFQLRTVPVKTPQQEIDQQAIEVLEFYIDQVKSGVCTEVIVIGKMSGGKWGHKNSGTLNVIETVGQLEIMKHDLVDAVIYSDDD